MSSFKKIKIVLFAFFLAFSFTVQGGVSVSAETKVPDDNPQKTAHASIEKITEYYEAVGTVRPRTENAISPQVTAQVINIMVRPGDHIEKGDLLATLDNRTLLSRLDQAKQELKTAKSGREQAKQSVMAAEAEFKQAQSEYNRIETFHKQQAATQRDLERAKAAFLRANAELEGAKEALSGTLAAISKAKQTIQQAEITLGYTTIKAPEAGNVLQRLAEPGDLAIPGKPLIILRTEGHLRLEAYVREGLIRKIKKGAAFPVYISTVDTSLTSTVEEIVPYADPKTRTFLVKTALPDHESIFPGMFGKLLIPVKEQQVVVVPEKAVWKVGQLELIKVKQEHGWETRYIMTGGKIGEGKIEVLSGLAGNETVALREL